MASRLMSSCAVAASSISSTMPSSVTKVKPSETQTEMRGSRRRCLSLTRPALVFMMMSSPRSSYHITVWCGCASGAMVARTAKRRSSRKRRTAGLSVIVLSTLSMYGLRAPADLNAVQLRRDLGGDQVKDFGIGDVGHIEDRLVYAHLRQTPEVVNRRARGHRPIRAVAREAQRVERRLLDLVVGPAQPLAVVA